MGTTALVLPHALLLSAESGVKECSFAGCMVCMVWEFCYDLVRDRRRHHRRGSKCQTIGAAGLRCLLSFATLGMICQNSRV